MFVSKLWDDFSAILFPNICAGCNNELVGNEELICSFCLLNLHKTNFFEKRDNATEKKLWGRARVVAATSYLMMSKGNLSQRLIHQLKYNGKTEIGTVYKCKSIEQEKFFVVVWHGEIN
mgnify:CR=1 FL=1